MNVTAESVSPGRPVLRYHGGKWRLAPWIIAQFPPHRVYVEPFGGGASVLLRKPRSYGEVYNDLDEEVVNVFQVLRNPAAAAELRSLLELTPYARVEFNAAYLPTPDPVERARRTIIRSFMGFGSDGIFVRHVTGFRANANRSGTTPAQDWRNYPDIVPAFVERLRGVTIENRQALAVIRQHDGPRTLHYLDPPYVRSTRSRADAGRGYLHEMTDGEHEEMLRVARDLVGMVVISGYRCELYDDLLGDWRRVDAQTLADGARRRTESLWLNPAAVAARADLFSVRSA